MAISFVNVAGVSNGTAGTSINIPMPSGVANGQVLLASTVHIGAGTLGITPPSGWTLLTSTNSGNNSWDLQFNTYYHIATSSEPSSYVWTIGGTGVQNGGYIAAFSGVDIVSAIEATAIKEGTGNVYSSSAISTAVNGDWVAFITGIASNDMTYYNSPGTYLGRWTLELAGAANLALATQVRATAGAVPTDSWTNDAVAGDHWGVHNVALKINVPTTAPIIGAASNLTNRQHALRRRRRPKAFCGWLNDDSGSTVLLPATLLPVYDLPRKPKRRARVGWFDEPRPGNVASPPPSPTPTPPPPPSPSPPPATSTGSMGPKISLPAPTLTNEDQWRRQTAAWMREANQGHLQNTGIITLAANQSSTVVADPRVGASSFIEFMPRTANAAIEKRNGTMFISSQGKQTFTISHALNAQTDRTFVYTVLG